MQNGVNEFGTVISIGDGIARVVGLNRVQAERWWSSDQESEEWPSISKLTMSVSSSSETTGRPSPIQRNPGR